MIVGIYRQILEERKYRKPERAFQREVDEAEKTIWMRESAPFHYDCRNNQATEARMSPLSAWHSAKANQVPHPSGSRMLKSSYIPEPESHAPWIQ